MRAAHFKGFIYIYIQMQVCKPGSFTFTLYIYVYFVRNLGGQNLKKGLPWDDGATHGLSSQVEVGGWAPESPYVMVENFCRLVAFR